MSQTISAVILNETTSLYDVISFITNNNSDKHVYINLDTIVNYIYIKSVLSNTSKLRTKAIQQLGTYDFKGLTRKQIAKKILNDMTKLNIMVFVYSLEYKIRDELNIKKIQFNDDIKIESNIIVIDVNDYLATKIKEYVNVAYDPTCLSSIQMKN
jgi:hypothetical protein